MDLLKELRELKDTIGHEIAEANAEIKKKRRGSEHRRH